MKVLDRFNLELFSGIILIISVVLCLFTFGWVEINDATNALNSELQLKSKEHDTLIQESQVKIFNNETKINELTKNVNKNESDIKNNNELLAENKKKIDPDNSNKE